ncbi:MAG: NUDIX domain-containing protein [Planctomycetaceae bacterium]
MVELAGTQRRSAGILLWRRHDGLLEVLLGHQGGPEYVSKDAGYWSVLKGEIEPGEDPLEVARREFEEESGSVPPDGRLIELGEVRQKGGKLVVAWALEGDLDPSHAVSNTFETEWPPGSGTFRTFPEIDRVGWFDVAGARAKIKPTQAPFLERLERALADAARGPAD